ncbi:hypothetical protein [Leeia aquatica]|uniref:Uncharacterized protein n=1 Tax=Leeia aquatica TaxID=2725557 RepID=A0A847RWS6_9NEIS|nr:hypothetical protein [Leeia aquatica]NLR74241.1 hypothetical protein [Leeia aquatica]
MQRDIALRLDAMLMQARGSIDQVAHYMKRHLTDAEFDDFRQSLGASMVALIEISNALHQQFPDTVPEELRSDEISQ